MVKPEDVSDSDISLIARDIVKKIENELDYPGQIKVNVIRKPDISNMLNRCIFDSLHKSVKSRFYVI